MDASVGFIGCLAIAGTLFAMGAPANVHAAAPSAQIHAAVRSGDLEQVQAALKGGADLNAPDDWGRTPLIVALQQGKAPVVEFLVGAGANLAATDAWGRTPLLVATQMKNTAAIRLLLEKKSDVNAANKNDITPLIAATQTGNRDAAALLLAAGASPDLADNLGWTALMWAKYRKDEAIAKMLLDRGASAAASSAPRAKPPAPVAPRKASPAFDAGRIVRGNPDAAITLFEYTDFQCPYCRHGAKVVDEVMARYEGQVRLVVKHLPLPLLHPMAMSCALHFEAISLQGAAKAWAFYDRIFLDPGALAGGDAYLRKLASELGVDLQRLDEDLRGAVVRGRIDADLRESALFKFDGVPAFVINGEVIEGAQPAARFFAVIDAAQRR